MNWKCRGMNTARAASFFGRALIYALLPGTRYDRARVITDCWSCDRDRGQQKPLPTDAPAQIFLLPQAWKTLTRVRLSLCLPSSSYFFPQHVRFVTLLVLLAQKSTAKWPKKLHKAYLNSANFLRNLHSNSVMFQSQHDTPARKTSFCPSTPTPPPPVSLCRVWCPAFLCFQCYVQGRRHGKEELSFWAQRFAVITESLPYVALWLPSCCPLPPPTFYFFLFFSPPHAFAFSLISHFSAFSFLAPVDAFTSFCGVFILILKQLIQFMIIRTSWHFFAVQKIVETRTRRRGNVEEYGKKQTRMGAQWKEKKR